MKRYILLILAFSLNTSFAQYTKADIYSYIEQYKELAIKKMYEYKIPASITLAQGVFESAAGTSKLATEANNHFGIKCHKEWTGDSIHIDDDAKGECFRSYTCVEDSYSDHSLFLTSRSRYEKLFTLDIMDYKSWATELKIAGYATNPEYATRLIKVIETYGIAKHDTICQQRILSGYYSSGNITEKSDKNLFKEEFITVGENLLFITTEDKYPAIEYPFTNRKVYENNKTIFVIAKKGDTYEKIAKEVQDSEKNLRKYNDAGKKTQLYPGEVVYLEQKNKHSYIAYCIANQGETLNFISQKYAVRLKILLGNNKLSSKSIIKKGDRICLNAASCK